MTPQDQMRAAGFEYPPENIKPGKHHRFPDVGKKQSNRSAWCCSSLDESAVFFKGYASGMSGTWFRDDKTRLDDEAIKRAHEALRRRHAERDRKQAAARIRAQRIWARAATASPNHLYLKRKAIGTHSARQSGDALILDIRTLDGRLASLQFIKPNGDKKLLAGGRKVGCVIHIDRDEERHRRVLICEGWATGCTLAAQDDQGTVLAAIDASNLKPVAIEARKKWPDAKIVIAADDDRRTPGNPGMAKARAAAIACGGKMACPQWPDGSPDSLTDFNDLDVWLRLNAAREDQP